MSLTLPFLLTSLSTTASLIFLSFISNFHFSFPFSHHLSFSFSLFFFLFYCPFLPSCICCSSLFVLRSPTLFNFISSSLLFFLQFNFLFRFHSCLSSHLLPFHSDPPFSPSFAWSPFLPSPPLLLCSFSSFALIFSTFSPFSSHSSSHCTPPPAPLTSSTVPVLPPPAPPARIDFVLVNLEPRGAQEGGGGILATERKWAEADVDTSYAAWWSFHHLGHLSTPPTPPLPCLFSLFFLPCFFAFLSFPAKLQDVSKYHAGLQTERWQTIEGRCGLIISSALWLTSISLLRHWAAAKHSENMQSGGLHTSQIYS